MEPPATGYDAIVNAAALVYAGRASVTQIKSQSNWQKKAACDVTTSPEPRNTIL